jgi:NAD(P)H-dependent flavin oxidoreductase YrpB (nitropropane dioxygenase family)
MEASLLPQAPQDELIQGGMGFGIATWPLAREVSLLGGLGTVSGVALELLLTFNLERGDSGGHYRRALRHFPFPRFAQMVIDEFYIEEGNPRGLTPRAVPVFTTSPSQLLIALTVCANFAVVWLAKEGHDRPISINYLEKIQLPHPYAITGAMLARVDFITMGAGTAFDIAGMIRSILAGKEATYPVSIFGGKIKFHMMRFHPESFFGEKLPQMKLPGFIPIIASNLLGKIYKKELPPGSVQGFVVEQESAAGHNAPPRTRIPDGQGGTRLVYGFKDEIDWAEMAGFGIPFWIGGDCASPEKLEWAKSLGARGTQTGSIWAFSEGSGMDKDIRRRVRKLGFEGKLRVRTAYRFSPTNFPFKVVELDGTLSDPSILENFPRVCNYGVLVSLYEEPDGSIGRRCPAEPVESFVSKGGKEEDTVGRGCLCKCLLAAAGFGGIPIVTHGDGSDFFRHLMSGPDDSYTVTDAMKYLRS